MNINKNITVGIAVLWIVFALVDTAFGFFAGLSPFRRRQPLNFVSRALGAIKRAIVFLLMVGNVFLAFQGLGKIKKSQAG